MRRILVPVDGSEHSQRVVEHLIRRKQAGGDLELHLLNVQPPVESGHARMFLSRADLDNYYRDEGHAALARAREALDAAGVAYTHHVAVGHVAETIARFAKERAFDEIAMGKHGHTSLTDLLLGEVATEVVRYSEVPVLLIK